MDKIKLLAVLLICTGLADARAQSNTDSVEEPDSEIKNYKNWAVQCVNQSASGEKSCVLFQQLILENGQRLLTLQINPPAPGESAAQQNFVAIVNVPLGVYLPSGIGLQVDEAEPISLAYERCDNTGCYAGMPIDEGLRVSLIKGKSCKISFANLAGKVITATLSLSGFTAGFSAL